MKKLNNFQREERKYSRELAVYKSDEMIQKGRYNLSVQEQRTILYAISKIKPEDTKDTEYAFSLRDFYNVCGIKKDTYTTIKKMLKELGDKSWWIQREDGKESLVRWFNTIDCDINSDKVVFKFHERMMPYLLHLTDSDSFYTFYNLKYILPMSSKHSPRLYEILKSYQKNNMQWFFDIDELKKKMCCEHYKNFKDFRLRVLEPAVEEINKFTDICIDYDLKKDGRKVSKIVFYFDNKTKDEMFDVNEAIEIELDGQTSLFDFVDEAENSNMVDFLSKRRKAHGYGENKG